MFGVVIWSDRSKKNAVIWCEDHGELAYFKQHDDEGEMTLDSGDWVQFEMTMDRQMRYAHNPRLVVEAAYADLPVALQQQANDTGSFQQEFRSSVQRVSRRSGSEVIMFDAALASRKLTRN